MFYNLEHVRVQLIPMTTNVFTAAQQIAFENLVTATATAFNLTRSQAVHRLLNQGIEPCKMFA